MNIDMEKMPFSDEYFDFGYARHIFEDINNPEFAFKEFTSKCESGYIETPSPLIELTRNVDAGLDNNFRGYKHHRYIVYSDVKDNSLHFIPKFPIIEYLKFDPVFENKLKTIANRFPIYWNNYYTWNITSSNNINSNNTKCVIHREQDMFYEINYYINAIEKSIEYTNYFVQNILSNHNSNFQNKK
jgi:hypothetical protein